MKKIVVGISSCLLGERVRFDGGHKKHSFIVESLGQHFEYHSFCPEMAIGLGVPRETIRLVDIDGEVKVLGTAVDSTLDVGDALRDSANQQSEWHRQLAGYIVKKDSPSCGMERVKVYRGDHPERRGAGRYTQTLMQNFPELPVEEEGRLGDPGLRENFVQRVYSYQRWRDLLAGGLSWAKLTEFHARHKLILFSHDQNRARALGLALSNAHKNPLEVYASSYINELMSILKIVATRANHVNTLEHIRGYLKRELDAGDKRELTETIEHYRQGLLPLIVPITLLKHHFRKYPDPYIERSFYLQPHPHALMLLNSL